MKPETHMICYLPYQLGSMAAGLAKSLGCPVIVMGETTSGNDVKIPVDIKPEVKCCLSVTRE